MLKNHFKLMSILYTKVNITVIHEISLLKNFRLAQNDKNFLREKFLLVKYHTVNIWCAFDMNENIIT